MQSKDEALFKSPVPSYTIADHRQLPLQRFPFCLGPDAHCSTTLAKSVILADRTFVGGCFICNSDLRTAVWVGVNWRKLPLEMPT